MDYIPENLENTYIVQKGDSLWSIAKKYNLTVNELKELNNLSSNLLSIGQILKIKNTTESPNIESPAGSKIYIVQKGDTLYSIAKQFNITVEDLKKYNNLLSNILSINQQIIIPSYTEEESFEEYYVVKGDTLYTIAKKFNTSVEKLKKYNNLSSNTLSIGQKLLIPKEESKSTESEIIYIVQKGDSLYSIADKYSTTVETLKNINNLKSNLLSIGQKLVIPSTENYITYEVQKGDTLYAISQKYNVDIETIKNINNLANINLSINQKLIIPN